MSAQDELFQLMLGRTTTKAVERILAAGYRKPRTITAVGELDALPDGSAVLDRHGDVSTKHAHWWHTYETSPMMSQRLAKYGPLTVIHEPAA